MSLTARSRSRPSLWTRFFRNNWRPSVKIAFTTLASFGSISSVLIAVVVILVYPVPFACAVAAGAFVRWVGQQVKLRKLVVSTKPAALVQYEFQDGLICCHFDDGSIRKHISSLEWKIASGAAAGVVCWAIQCFVLIRVSLWHAPRGRALDSLIVAAGWGLPMIAGALVILADGPVERWSQQAKEALQARAAAALAYILQDRELDGLDLAISSIHQQLGCSRSSTYRGAIEKRLFSHADSLVLDPKSVSPLIETLNEAARLEWRELSEGLERYRRVEAAINGLSSAVRLAADIVLESRAEDLGRELKAAAERTIHWGWSAFEQELQRIEAELSAAQQRLRERRAGAVGAVLAPGSDPYRLLGVERSASTSSIKKLRLRLAQVYHPDIGGETSNAFKMAELNAAYDAILRDRSGREH